MRQAVGVTEQNGHRRLLLGVYADDNHARAFYANMGSCRSLSDASASATVRTTMSFSLGASVRNRRRAPRLP